MKTPLKQLLLIFPTLALVSLNSCVSTETLEPSPEENTESNRIVINLSAPLDVNTRAESDHQLRFVAKLHAGSPANPTNVISQRQELLADEEGKEGVKNQMVFYVPEGYTYTIYVFADFIPSDSKADENGYYKDHYYDTSIDFNTVEMLPSPGVKITDYRDVSIDPEKFFNNERYDCFGGVIYYDNYKTNEAVTLDLTLHRLVSKVRLVDTSMMKGNFDGDISNFMYIRQYVLREKVNDEFGSGSAICNKKISVFKNREFKGEGEDEFLYFYTFANPYTFEPQRPKLNLTLTDSSNPNESSTIDTGDIEVKRNYITTVKGKFLPGAVSDEPEQSKDGPIYLNISESEEPWENNSSTWNSSR